MSKYRQFRASLSGFIGICSLVLLPVHASESVATEADSALKVAMVIPGDINDNGFMQLGYDGLIATQVELGVDTRYIAGVKPRIADLMGALLQLAEDKPDMIISHGEQTGAATEVVAAQFPDIRFVVIQGDVTGPNLSSYGVAQEQSAWLAGAAAGLLTQSNVVGHISGRRVTPALNGRGAFHDGLKHTNPEAEFLTIFTGDQEDPVLAGKAADAAISAGADIIFTMLNTGREGASDAMRGTSVRQIGSERDWVSVEPAIFVGSAVADVSEAVMRATQNLVDGQWLPGEVVRIGLEEASVVNLSLGEDASDAVMDTLVELRSALLSGEIKPSVYYHGGEFMTPE